MEQGFLAREFQRMMFTSGKGMGSRKRGTEGETKPAAKSGRLGGSVS